MSSSSSTVVHNTNLIYGYEIERVPASDDDGRRWKRAKRTNSSLPDDILYEIILRLPAKTLFQFKHACKFWYNLIRSPTFISTHYAFHKREKLSLCCHSYDRGASSITFLFSDISLVLTTRTTTFYRPIIVGCCYGLVCLSLCDSDTTYLLWNPATGQFRIIYISSVCCPAFTGPVYSGLHFDRLANTHKLVRISINLPYHEEEKFRVYHDVFTVGNNSWKANKDPLTIPCGIPSTRPTCIGKFMYWVTDEKCLLCFDMVDELFRRIEFPCLDHHRRPCVDLAEYKESLAMFVWNAIPFASPADQSFDMWVLNDCCCWSKKRTLRPSLPGVRSPVGFYVKGDVELVVLATGSGNLLWNADSGEVTRVPWEEGVLIRRFFLYSQSLASVG